MSGLKAVLRNAHLDGQLMLTEVHSQWMELPEDEQIYSEQAIDFVTRWMRRQFKKPRKGRFSASSIGHPCVRRRLFDYMGVEQVGNDLDSLHIMGSGTKGHLFWQMEGFSYPFDAPWLADAEVWTHDPHYQIGGSIDGILDRPSAPVLEVKTVAMGKFSRIQRDDTPEYEHLLQIAVYLMLRDVTRATLIYDDRNTGQFHEFIVLRDEVLEDEVTRRLERMNNDLVDDTVPPQLDDCEMRQGTVFKECPYRKMCHNVKSKLSECLPYVKEGPTLQEYLNAQRDLEVPS